MPMLTEQDYIEVLEELGFALPSKPNTGKVSRSLRHTIRRFLGIPSRNPDATDAFWSTLYWNPVYL